MRKAGLLLIGAALTLAVFVAPAFAGQNDCSHGNSGQDCRPDPNENGQDCEEHGQSEGNEDHCLTTTVTTTSTTSAPPVTTTTSVTEPPETTTTSTVPTSTTTIPTETEPPSTSTEPPVVTTTTTTTTTTSPSASLTTQSTPPIVTVTSEAPPTQDPQPTKRDSRSDSESATRMGSEQPKQALAFTGIEDVVPIGAAALALLTTGSGLLWLSRRKDA